MELVDILKDPYNNTTKYILPILGDKNELLVNNSSISFINCYLNWIDKPFLDNHIFVLYKLKADKSLSDNLLKLIKHPNYFDQYTFIYEEQTYLVLVLIITPEYKKDFLLLLNSKVSETTIKYKLKVINFWHILDPNSNIYRTLYGDTSIEDYRILEASWHMITSMNQSRESLPEIPITIYK